VRIVSEKVLVGEWLCLSVHRVSPYEMDEACLIPSSQSWLDPVLAQMLAMGTPSDNPPECVWFSNLALLQTGPDVGYYHLPLLPNNMPITPTHTYRLDREGNVHTSTTAEDKKASE